jgi:hypothetical protein
MFFTGTRFGFARVFWQGRSEIQAQRRDAVAEGDG